MTFKCYLGRPHERPAEEIAARTLARELRLSLEPGEWAALAFNLKFWRDCQVDAVLFTPHAVTVLDWKDTLGPIEGGEHGPWLRNGEPIKAGSENNENPYQQIRRIRQIVAAFIYKNSKKLLDEAGARFDRRAFHRVGAAIVFTPADPEKNIALPSTTRSWLTITGLDVAARVLTAHRSPLTLRAREAETLIEQGWGCRRWELVENILPERPVGVLWHVREDGTRQGWLLTRTVTIGRGKESDLVLAGASPHISRRHAQVHVAGGEAVLYDLGSDNGTYLNGHRLDGGQPRPLTAGDELWVGGPPKAGGAARIEFNMQTEGADDKTTHQQSTQ